MHMGVQIPKQLKQKTPARTIGLAKNDFLAISFGKTLISLQESNRSLGTAPHITVCNEVAKVMFLHLSVILSTGGGICLSACWDTTPPQDQAPGTRYTPLGPGPPDQAPPPRGQVPLGPDTPPDQTPPPPGAETATAADGTHPTGMHSCFILLVRRFYMLCLNIALDIIRKFSVVIKTTS